MENNKDLKLLRCQMSPSRFIEEFVYPYSYEPGAEKYVLGRVHKKEWEPALLGQKQIMLTAPRDHLKSFFCTESYALWKAAYTTGLRIYIISKTDGQVKQRIANIKKIVERSQDLKWLKPHNPDNWSKMMITLTNGATVSGAGYFSAHRGGHPHLLILDDPVEEEVIYSPDLNQKYIERFLQTILPMAEPYTQIIIIGTRQCEGDLYDNCKPPQWYVMGYSAIVNEEKKETLFPEKWPWDALMERKTTIVESPKGGLRIWLKEYENNVSSMKGQIVKLEHFKFWYPKNESKPTSGRFTGNVWLPIFDKLEIYQGWDLNVTKNNKPRTDYTACVTIGIGRDTEYKMSVIFVLNVFRARLNMPERLLAINDQADMFPEVIQIGIEDVAFQDDTVQAAIREMTHSIVPVKQSVNKIARLESCCSLFVNGKVAVRPEHLDFIEEIIAFPTGMHDDMFDAFDIAMLISRMKRRINVIKTGTQAGIQKPSLALDLLSKYQMTTDDIKVIEKDKLYFVQNFLIEFDTNGTVFKGPVWLLGKTMGQVIKTVNERNKGVQESNAQYDGIPR